MNNNELKHYGVPGMKWGKRKAREDFNREVKERREQLINKSAKLDKQTKWHKWEQKHPNSKPNDYDDDYLNDDPIAKKSSRLYETAQRIDPGYVKQRVMDKAAVSAVFAAPLAMYVTGKAAKTKLKKSSHRVAAVLGAGMGAVSVGALAGYISGRRQHKKALKSEGIKTVRERQKEQRNKK